MMASKISGGSVVGGEKLPAASNALLPNLKKGLFFAIGDGSRIYVACFLHSSAQMCLYQTPGRRPPPIVGRFVNTVTRGWVGAPDGRAPFRFHGAVVGLSIDGCPGLGISPLRTNMPILAQDRKIGPGITFFGVFEKFATFFSKICAHSEWYRNLLAGIFEILTFYGNIAFPLSPVLRYFCALNGLLTIRSSSQRRAKFCRNGIWPFQVRWKNFCTRTRFFFRTLVWFIPGTWCDAANMKHGKRRGKQTLQSALQRSPQHQECYCTRKRQCNSFEYPLSYHT